MIDTTETTLELLVRYGLYLGAAFQLACIGAVVFVNSEPVNSNHRDDSDDDVSEHGSPVSGHASGNTLRHRRKGDKKKRR